MTPGPRGKGSAWAAFWRGQPSTQADAEGGIGVTGQPPIVNSPVLQQYLYRPGPRPQAGTDGASTAASLGMCLSPYNRRIRVQQEKRSPVAANPSSPEASGSSSNSQKPAARGGGYTRSRGGASSSDRDGLWPQQSRLLPKAEFSPMHPNRRPLLQHQLHQETQHLLLPCEEEALPEVIQRRNCHYSHQSHTPSRSGPTSARRRRAEDGSHRE